MMSILNEMSTIEIKISRMQHTCTIRTNYEKKAECLRKTSNKEGTMSNQAGKQELYVFSTNWNDNYSIILFYAVRFL